MAEMIAILTAIGLPYAYDHFAEGEAPNLPYLVFLFPGSDNFGADGKVWFKFNTVHLELYTEKKDPTKETLVENALDSSGVFYNKTETWISSERLYEVLYTFELEG